MKSNQEVLSSLLKTAQMGQTGIRTVIPYAGDPHLKQALKEQLDEYDAIEQEALDLAAEKGLAIENLAPIAKSMSKMCTHFSLKFGNIDSKIAAMMIQGNTKGMIKGLKNLHHGRSIDHSLENLAQKLLEKEAANIEQMQGFV